jgi:hypothetical protein
MEEEQIDLIDPSDFTLFGPALKFVTEEGELNTKALSSKLYADLVALVLGVSQQTEERIYLDNNQVLSHFGKLLEKLVSQGPKIYDDLDPDLPIKDALFLKLKSTLEMEMN